MRNKVILIVLLILYGINLSSQVTIGMGEAPIDGALLQLKENKIADDGANATKGLGFPRVQLTDENNLYPMFYDNSTSGPASAYQGAGKDALDKTHTGLVVYNTNNASPFQKGLYIWDGSLWTPVGGTSSGTTGGSRWAVTAARATQPLTDDHKDPVYRPGSVTIGEDDIHTLDAALNVAATDKGVLLPRVALTSPTDVATITKPSTGLLVYNTGTGEDANKVKFTTKGYMYWNGTEWRLIDNVSSATPQVNNWFYMPPIAFATDQDKKGEVKDLYSLYKAQFATPTFKSNGAPASIPYIPAADQLYYYITYADPAVFKINSISDQGIMNYDVTAAATEASFINIVFVLK
jgi:hypothetical protein